MMTNRIKLLYLIPIVIFLLIPSIGYPEITYKVLDPIRNGLKAPEDVAVSSDGKIYVVDGYQNRVFLYDRKGRSAGSIPIQKPTSVAVSGNGTLYISTNNDLSVKIFNSSYTIIGSLGKGAGEFRLPRNIVLDKATGNVYVIDQLDYSIKVYTSDGTYITKINDYPNLPQDVTIINNEIYVLDQPLITDEWGGKIRGAQVSVFDKSGNLIRTFGSYGVQEGQLKQPRGITSDSGGTLYITDSFLNAVMCFDTNGGFLGAIHTPSNPMVTTMGIALGQDRRLFAVSMNTASVYVFGLEGYTSMDVSPSALSFQAQEGEPNPSPQSITISNSGTGTLTYEVTGTESWIVINGPSGTVGPGGSGILSIGVNISGLSAGTYDGEITITDNSGISEVVTVTLEITAPPELPLLTVTPQILNYTYSIGDPEPSSQTVTLEISNGTATWTAVADSPWISIIPETGSGNTITFALVRVNPAGLGQGVYKGKITIDAPKAAGSPVNVEVNLTVISSGTIQVSCNIPEASFTITGPLKYKGSGETWTATEVPDGEYTITYNPVGKYKTPQTETKVLSSQEKTIGFIGNYTSLAMSAEIVVSRGAYSRTPQTIGIFNKGGALLASFIPFAGSRYNFQYGVNIAVGDIDGDGKSDIVAALGASSKNPAEVAAYGADGTVIPGSDFIGMNTMYGANVVVADFDGDGKAEIVAGAGPGPINPARVRIFKYDSGVIKDTGIDFLASKSKGGVNIAAGDVDGDGVPELITAAGASSSGPEIRVWKINTTGPSWSIIDTGIRFIFPNGYRANVTTGDLNGDGISEIIVSSADKRSGANIIRAFHGNGTEFGLLIKNLPAGYSVNIASADLNSDGIAEIVTGLVSYAKNKAVVKIYKADGTLLNTFIAFDNVWYGIAVSAGELGY